MHLVNEGFQVPGYTRATPYMSSNILRFDVTHVFDPTGYNFRGNNTSDARGKTIEPF